MLPRCSLLFLRTDRSHFYLLKTMVYLPHFNRTLFPGGPGIMPAGITTGVRGASLEVVGSSAE
jgi:hypothetical protein